MVSNGTDNMVMPVAPMYGGYNKNHEMIEKLEAMIKEARTPEERESYRSAIEHMRRS